jgi:tetratricopeptide (TPR) repeat protein
VSRVTDSLHIRGSESAGQRIENRLRTSTNQRFGTLAADDGRPDGLVVDLGFLKLTDPQGEPQFVSRYEFVSALHWQALRRYGLGPSEIVERSERYAWALTKVYAPEPTRVAPLIATLLHAAGKHQAAADFDRQADFDTTLAAQRRHALAVLNMPTDGWDQWDYVQATVLLLRAAKTMQHTSPLRETLVVYEGAAAFAQRADLRPEWATALLGRGVLHFELGESAQAGQVLAAARGLARELGERATAAEAAYRLGVVNRWRGNLAAARRDLEEALDNYRRLGSRGNEAVTRQGLGMVAFDEGDLVVAREQLTAALEILRRLRGHQQQTALCWQSLARVDYRDGDLAAAAAKGREALRLVREIDDRVNEASVWHLLGLITTDQGDLEAAADHFDRALTLQRQLGDMHGQAATFGGLGIVAMRRGELGEARGHLVRALRLAQRLDDRLLEADIWRTVADLAGLLGRPDASASLRAASVLLYRPLQKANAARWAEVGYQQLQTLARQHPAAGDADALLALAERAYRQDRGWGSIEATFGPLDDLESEPSADETPPGPPGERRDSGPVDTRSPRS